MKKLMRKLTKGMLYLMPPWVIYRNWEHLKPFTRLVMLASLTVIIPITVYLIEMTIEKKTKEFTKQQKKSEKKSMEKAIEEIYERERMPYYQDAHYLFNQLMRAGKLQRNDILKLKHMIDSSLGNYALEYEDMSFKNDAHEVYVKFKNKHIDEKDWSTIIKYLQTR